MITDGIPMRLAPDRFWYGQADGDLFSWLKANARTFDDVGSGAMLDVRCAGGDTRRGAVCDTPMYDESREIPRGLRVDIPEIPGAEEA